MKPTLFYIAYALALTFLGSRMDAQTTGEKNALPPGPIIVALMPDFAQWTIDYIYSNAVKPGEDSVQLARYKKLALEDPALAKAMEDPNFVYTLNPARPKHVMITKTGDIRHEEDDLERDLKKEIWCSGDVKVERGPNKPDLIVSTGNVVSSTEFPEFNWISRQGFTGIETANGHQCLVFKQEVDPIMISIGRAGVGTTVPAVAYIDRDTHYPVSLQFGVETRQYTILSPPPAQLTIPEDVAAAMKAMEVRIQEAGPHLSPP